MHRVHGRRRASWLALALALAAVGLPVRDRVRAAAARKPADVERPVVATSDPNRLATGVLLVARRNLPDPNFSESVVLLFAYSKKDGAAGLIVNRRTTMRARQVLPDLPVAPGAEPILFSGGPVSRAQVRGLLRSPLPDAGTRVLADVALVGTAAMLDALADGAKEDELRLYAGLSGWSPGQLEREVERGDWHITNGDSKIIFASDPDAVWRRQIRIVDVITVLV